MNSDTLVISRGNLQKGLLSGKIVLITGAGGGIGFEAARSLIWLGAKVIIAEVNKQKGKLAETKLNREFGEDSSLFIPTDVGNERSIKKLANKINKTFGRVDVIINNATIAPLGAVHKAGIKKWDASYSVNLRGPVLLTSYFLPQMLDRNSGIIVFVPSSGAAPYMGPYEVFKTSQVELCNTISAELEETEVIAFSIGPGIVKTETAHNAIKEIAPLYNKSVDEFYKMSEGMLITAEEAGAGFAASIAQAQRYRGLEIGSIQALVDAGISIDKKEGTKETDSIIIPDGVKSDLSQLFNRILKNYIEQSDGWNTRPVFERQWLLRDFKKQTGAAPEFMREGLKDFENKLEKTELSKDDIEKVPLKKLYSYYEHQLELLKGYEKNPEKLKESSAIISSWLEDIDNLLRILKDIQ